MGSFAFIFIPEGTCMGCVYIFLCVYVCVFLHTCACRHNCTSVLVCMWRPTVTMGFLPLYLVFGDRISSGQRAHRFS